MEDGDGDGRYGARGLDENKRTFLEFSFNSNFILCRSCCLSLVISLHLMSPSLFAFSFFKSACFWQSLNFLDNSLLSTALFFCHSMHAFSQFYGTILPLSWFILHSFIYFVFFFFFLFFLFFFFQSISIIIGQYFSMGRTSLCIENCLLLLFGDS